LKDDKNISDNLPITDLNLNNENFLAILKYGVTPFVIEFQTMNDSIFLGVKRTLFE